MALGAAIFLCSHLAGPKGDGVTRRIVIDAPLERRIAELSRAQNGLIPTAEEMRRLESDYINDEVWYREALRLGLDRNDEIVRRRLVQKVMFLQHDLAVPAVPSEGALREYYEAHAAAFRTTPAVSFEQIYFSPDRGGWSGAQSRAWSAYSYLGHHENEKATQMADPSPVILAAGELSRQQLAAALGDTPAVEALFTLEPGNWSQPVRSGYGWHLLRVIHRTESYTPSFDRVRVQVESAWRDAETETNEQRQLASLRAQYPIVRTP